MMILFAIIASAMLNGSPVQQRFDAGETLDYSLSWLRITGGGARMTIAPHGEGEKAGYRITSVAKSTRGFSRIFRVRDEIETIVAHHDFSTLRYTKRLDEEEDKIDEVTTVEDGVATRVRKKVKKVNVPRPVYDPISVIYYLRLLDLAEGRVHELTLVADGKLYTVHAKVIRRETIDTPAGSFKTVLVEPAMESGGKTRDEKMSIWYSDDERRIPVRIRSEVKVGAITATLKAVRNGAGPAEPPIN